MDSSNSRGRDSPVRVLIVDDDKLTRMVYASFLSREGFEVVTATSGSEALEELRSRAFDLVLLDYMMPQMTGLELLEMLPAQSLASSPRFVIMTGAGDSDVAERGKELGALEVLIKPVPPRVLRDAAERAIAAGPTAPVPPPSSRGPV